MKHLPRSYEQDGRIRLSLIQAFVEYWLVMMDLIFVVGTVAFFVISIAYVSACDRLR